MTNRERMLAVLAHEHPDRIPWVPRLHLWYNARQLKGTMPERFRGMSLREIESTLGFGTPAREGEIYTVRIENVEEITERRDGKHIHEFRTPVGSVRSVVGFSDELDQDGLPGRDEEYFLKGPDDYRVWEYIVEHTYWEPAYDRYEAYDREIGDDGLPMVYIGDVPFHAFAQKLAGYEHAYYQLADHKTEVEHLLATMQEVERERLWPVVLDSPAPLLQHGVHLSSQFTPPAYFERYIIPYYRDFFAMVHDRGKRVAMHADNDVSMIMDHIERAGWDIVECFVTEPMVPLSLERAREVWGERMIIWGGIPSLILSPSVPEDDFRRYVEKIFRTVAPGNSFILGVADNVMPDSLIERVEWISEIVEKRGYYPVG